MKQKYVAIRAWHGVAKGDTVEFKGNVPAVLRANVRPVVEGTDHTVKVEAPEQPGMLAPLVPETPPVLAPLEPPAAPADKSKK